MKGMKFDAVNHNGTLNKTKVVIVAAIALVFIVVFSFLGIRAAEGYNKKQIAERKEKEQQATLETETTNVASKVQERKKEMSPETNNDNKAAENANSNENQGNAGTETTTEQNQNTEMANTALPVYSETAKKKMKALYTDTSGPKTAYLTFDDGPSQAVTPQILETLKKEKIKATFFVMGKNVRANPELVKQEYAAGHYIANHSYTHEYASIYKSVDHVFNEFNKTEEAIQNALGNKDYHTHLFRFPGGSNGGRYAKLKAKARTELNKKNISYLDWNALTGDAEGANSKKKIIQKLKNTVKGKHTVVILMHDAAGKILTAEMLPEVIKYLRDEGYTFDNFYSIMK